MQPSASPENRAPIYAACRKLSISAPFRWLKKGWEDFRRVPWRSLTYGSIFALIGWLLLYFAWIGDNDALAFSFLAGFLIVGPVLAFGLYTISHQLELNREPTFLHERRKALSKMGHELMFALMLFMMFALLLIVASMVFEPIGIRPTPEQKASFLVISSLIAVIIASMVFGVSAFALPMILDQDVDAATAIVTSLNAVLRNLGVSALWAILIFILTAVGFATALIGIAFVLPVLGYATWHAYRETIITS